MGIIRGVSEKEFIEKMEKELAAPDKEEKLL
jgi:hypothetical protein